MMALRLALAVLITSTLLYAQDLTDEQLAMLRDDSGWEILTVTDANNGFALKHSCFNPNDKGPCEGKMAFHKDGTFAHHWSINGKTRDRSGTYKLDGAEVTFFDETGNKDGPFTLALELGNKTLTLEAVQAGVTLRTELLLESEYRRRLLRQKKNVHP